MLVGASEGVILGESVDWEVGLLVEETVGILVVGIALGLPLATVGCKVVGLMLGGIVGISVVLNVGVEVDGTVG